LFLVAEKPSEKKPDHYKNIDADYYGFRDEDDGELLEYENNLQKECNC
jgi:pre-mRNA-splicing factor ISY1